MTLYFLSSVPAGLWLDGIHLGNIDLIERHIETEGDNVLIQIVPAENLQPLNFFFADIPHNLPHDIDVYEMGEDKLLYIRQYQSKQTGLAVIAQARLCGNLVTVFRQGGIYVSVEGLPHANGYTAENQPIFNGYTANQTYNNGATQPFALHELPPAFAVCTLQEGALANRPVIQITAGDYVAILSATGEVLFLQRVKNITLGDTLLVDVVFETCTRATCHCEYTYDGQLQLLHSHAVATTSVDERLLPYALFEGVMTGCDVSEYLTPDLKGKAGQLKGYLGDFVDVVLPTEKFALNHPDTIAVGLVYAKGENVFTVRYYAVTIADGLIDNVTEVT